MSLKPTKRRNAQPTATLQKKSPATKTHRQATAQKTRRPRWRCRRAQSSRRRRAPGRRTTKTTRHSRGRQQRCALRTQKPTHHSGQHARARERRSPRALSPSFTRVPGPETTKTSLILKRRRARETTTPTTVDVPLTPKRRSARHRTRRRRLPRRRSRPRSRPRRDPETPRSRRARTRHVSSHSRRRATARKDTFTPRPPPLWPSTTVRLTWTRVETEEDVRERKLGSRSGSKKPAHSLTANAVLPALPKNRASAATRGKRRRRHGASASAATDATTSSRARPTSLNS